MIIAGHDYGYAVTLAKNNTTSEKPYTVVRLLEPVTYESYGTAVAGHYVVMPSSEVLAFQADHASEPVFTQLFPPA